MSVDTSHIDKAFHEALQTHQKGDVTSAEKLYREILEQEPNYLPALYNLLQVQKAQKAFDAALKTAGKLEKLQPKNPEVWNQKGILYELKGMVHEAFSAYQQAIRIDPAFVKAYNNLGVLLYRLHRYKDAIAVFEEALKHVPEDTQTLCNLGAAYNRIKAYEKAEHTLQKAIAIDGNVPGAYVNLGNVYNKLGKHLDALACHVRALEFDSNSAANHANLAITYKHLERYDEAIAEFQKAIEIDPEFANAHFDLATTWLLLGEYEKGFREYEWRFKKEEMRPLLHRYAEILKKPKFTLFSETKEKTLLLWSEQGYGDMIQFIRFAKPLKEIYPDLTLKVQCRDALKPLFETLPYIDEVVSRNEDPGSFDYQYAIMSLPYLLEIEKEHIPNKPYIPVQEETVSLDLHPLKYNIGLVWGGSVTGESYPEKIFSPADFSALMEHIDIDLFSLQVGEDAAALEKLGLTEEQIVDLSPQLTDFQKTAAAIQQLDLVITSDTSVAHLAGAMGKEVWILLMKKADWRWGLESSDTVWYPNARLFRQKKQGEWQPVFDEVIAALEAKYYIDIKGKGLHETEQ